MLASIYIFFFAVLWDCYTYCTGHFFPKLVTNSILWNDSAKKDSDHSSALGPRRLSHSQENPKHNWKIWKDLFVSETFFFVVYFLLRVPFFFFLPTIYCESSTESIGFDCPMRIFYGNVHIKGLVGLWDPVTIRGIAVLLRRWVKKSANFSSDRVLVQRHPPLPSRSAGQSPFLSLPSRACPGYGQNNKNFLCHIPPSSLNI